METLKELLQKSFTHYRHKVAGHFLDKEGQWTDYTYAQFEEKVQAFIQENQLHHFPPHAQIGILSENAPQWLVCYVALVECDLIPVLLDSGLSGKEIFQQMEIVHLRGIYYSPTQADKILSLVKPQENFALLKCKGKVADDLADVVSILFTSGTQGGFKAVKITNENIIGIIQAAKIYSKRADALSILPFHHIFGLLSGFLYHFTQGLSLTYMGQITPENIQKCFADQKPGSFICVPRLLELMHKKIFDTLAQQPPFKRKLAQILMDCSLWIRNKMHINIGKILFKKVHKNFGGNLQCVYSGGSALEGVIFNHLTAMGFNIIEGYGLTETTGMCLANQYNRGIAQSVGQPITGIEAQIILCDENGIGELCVRGPTVMKGYYHAHTPCFDMNNWFHTGDLAKWDKEGNIYITGRLKETIVTSGGKKISPSIVESYYKNLSGVKELAVVGVPIKSGGTDQIFAVIELEPVTSDQVPVDSLQEKIRKDIHLRAQNIPQHLRIERVHFVEVIKKTTALKVKRKEIKEDILQFLKALEEESLKKEQEEENHILTTKDKIIQVIAHSLKKNKKQIDPDVHLSEYGIDSLMAMHILNELSHVLGKPVPPEKLFSNPTITDLSHYLDHMDALSVTPEEGQTAPIVNTPIAHTLSHLKDENPALRTQNLFLTGCTGVLGGQLLKQLLTMPEVTVYCLVRAKSQEEARKRISVILAEYQVPAQDLAFGDKLIPVLGDVEQVYFGMAKENYLALTEKIDLTLHAAAKTSLHGLYDELKATNVMGTQQAIQFALQTKQKYLTYISSYSVMGDIAHKTESPFLEGDFSRGQRFKNLGYQQTKFEAEALVREARSQGLRWLILRPGNIFGESFTGAYPLGLKHLHGIFYDLLKTIIETRLALISASFFDITPVDYVAEGILYLSMKKKDLYHTYHLVNPDIKRYYEVIHILQQCGCPIELVSSQDYFSRLHRGEITVEGNEYISATLELAKFNPTMMGGREGTYASAHHAREVLAQANIICPPIDEKLLSTYLHYCLEVGYLNN